MRFGGARSKKSNFRKFLYLTLQKLLTCEIHSIHVLHPIKSPLQILCTSSHCVAPTGTLKVKNGAFVTFKNVVETTIPNPVWLLEHVFSVTSLLYKWQICLQKARVSPAPAQEICQDVRHHVVRFRKHSSKVCAHAASIYLSCLVEDKRNLSLIVVRNHESRLLPREIEHITCKV